MFEKTRSQYEVTWAKTQEELTRDGGERQDFTKKSEAMKFAKEQAKKFPYVYLEKCFIAGEFDYIDSEFIWSHNPHNW